MINHRLGQITDLINAGRAEEARGMLLRLMPKSGTDPAVNRLMAECQLRLGQGPQALYYAQRAAQRAPDDVNVLTTLANCLWPAGREEEAFAAARRAVERDPGHGNARATLINFLVRHELYAQAAEQCRLGLEVDPGRGEFAVLRASMLLSLGRPEEGCAILSELRTRHPGNLRVLAAIVPLMNYVPGADPTVTLTLAREYGDALALAMAGASLPPSRPSPADSQRPLRLALLSPDLRSHPMRFFIEPLFEHLDRAAFTLTAFFTGAHEDEVSRRLKRHTGAWRHVPHLAPLPLAQAIRADGIDVLLDLAGHTLHERLAAIHLRPAPLQLTFLGYPGPTGVRTIDYQVVDSRTDPPGAEAGYTERLMRLDPCFVCVRPSPNAPAVSPLPALGAGRVTFGSFNALMKVNDRVVALWARLLAAIPESRLIIKNVQLMQPEAAALTRERFARAGCPPARLDIRAHKGSHADHLASYSEIDIALDTFPYNGATTTCEALHMGVPVIGIDGDRSAGRVGRSLLACMGMEDLVARDENEYIEIAARLAASLHRLSALRQTLRERFIASPICDERAWVRRFEAGVRTAWRELCARPQG